MNLRKTILEAINSSDLAPMEKIKLRIAMRITKYRDQIESVLMEELILAGMLPATTTVDTELYGATDWLAFIKALIPLILALLGK